MTGIIIPIGSLRFLKEAKSMDMILDLSVNFNIVFLFSVTDVVGTLCMRQFQCHHYVYQQHMSFQ